MIKNWSPFFPGDSTVGVFIICVALNVPVILLASPVITSESSSIFFHVLSCAVEAVASKNKNTNDKKYLLIDLFCGVTVYRNMHVYLFRNFFPYKRWNFYIEIGRS